MKYTLLLLLLLFFVLLCVYLFLFFFQEKNSQYLSDKLFEMAAYMHFIVVVNNMALLCCLCPLRTLLTPL